MARKITIEPSQSSYRETGHDGLRLTPVDAGPPRLRKDKAVSNPIVDLMWEVELYNFTVLTHSYLSHRNEDWEIPLVSAEAGHGDYLCRLIPGTFKWKPRGAAMYSVSCSVEIMGVA